MRLVSFLATLVLALSFSRPATAASAAPDFTLVQALFKKHCVECHSVTDAENNLILENFASLMKGGDGGVPVLPGKSADSLLMKSLEGRDKVKIMPPGKKKKLDASELAVIKAWIDGGAKPPAIATEPVRELVTPKIAPRVTPRKSIQAIAFAAQPNVIAVARYREVELRDAETGALRHTLTGIRGNVNSVAFSTDGRWVAAAGGEPGLQGQAAIWRVTDGGLVRKFEGHFDALYSVALSPDGKLLATGSYDQKIKLWDTATGKEVRTLTGHNGAVYGLAFRPDGRVLASASGDRTVKLWEVATGKRLDTFSQPTKEQYTVAFSPDGRRLVAGGVDNRIRLYAVSAGAVEGTNQLLESKFAHEGAVLRIVFASDGATLLSSAEDRTVKWWDAAKLVERGHLDPQPDLAPAVAFTAGNTRFVVGRLDGTLQFFDAKTGQPGKVAVNR
ncbi:MAG: cytochrome C [Limisphaerales bacterium]|nr:MAG: cytochrome C [Limisphaerales bacterium]TXT50067.1 MAG: cytochrome C [Limisphaerales bacterium]